MNEKIRKYIGILKFDNNFKLPTMLEATDNADAMVKIAKYCKKEGYFPIDIEIVEVCREIVNIK